MGSIGFALTDQYDSVFIDTVAATKRAAMVNALVAHFRVPVFQQDSYAYIERLFSEHSHGVLTIKPVVVHVTALAEEPAP